METAITHTMSNQEKGYTIMQATQPVVAGKIAWGRLPVGALLAAAVAVVANALIYVVASALGAIPQSVILPAPISAPLSAGPVVITSIIGTFAAAAVFAVIGVSARRPVRLFRNIATVALVLSLVMPATIPGAPVGMILSLMLMHIIAWAASVGALTTLAIRR